MIIIVLELFIIHESIKLLKTQAFPEPLDGIRIK